MRTIKLLLVCVCVTAVATAAVLADATLSQTSTGIYRIAGTIVRSTDGQPVPDLTVKVFDENGDQPLATGASDVSGVYDLTVEGSRLPASLQLRGELQRFIIRVFNRDGQVIKSPEAHVEITSRTNARVDFRLLPSDLNQTAPFVCGYGEDEARASEILQLPFPELTQALRSFITTRGADPRLNTSQQRLAMGLQQERTLSSCSEGSFSSLRAELAKSGQEQQIDQLKRGLFAPLDQEFITANFIVRYTTLSISSVSVQLPESDAELRMPNGELVGYIRTQVKDLPGGNKKVPPTQVQEVGLIAEFALKRFTEPPFNFRNPIPKKQKLDILIQVHWAAGSTDPHPEAANIIVNNLNSTTQNFATIPHELFHRVQYQYNRTSNRSGLYGVVREGGARFIEDSFTDEHNRYVFDSRRIFRDPAHSLITPPDACATRINYAAALFWKYVAEQHTLDTSCRQEPHIGIEAYRQVLESTAGTEVATYDTGDLRIACSKMPRPSSFDTFSYLDNAGTELESSETTWGNYLIANYVHNNDSSPFAERRFVYLEDHDLVTWPFTRFDDFETPFTVRSLQSLGAAIKPHNDLKLSNAAGVSRIVIGQLPYSATYYRITPDNSSASSMLRVSLSAFGGLTDPLVQILSFDADGILSDITRSDRMTYTRHVNLKNVSSIVVIVGSRATGGDYTLTLDQVAGGPDPMITRWNSKLLTEYENDSRDAARKLRSADLIIRNDELLPDPVGVVFGVDNRLGIRIHNRGRVAVENVQVDLQFQPFKPSLDPSAWQPVRNRANAPQTVSGVRLEAAGSAAASQLIEVDWAPAMASEKGWCVKATINGSGDLNPDNNLAIGCFSNSKVKPSLTVTRR